MPHDGGDVRQGELEMRCQIGAHVLLGEGGRAVVARADRRGAINRRRGAEAEGRGVRIVRGGGGQQGTAGEHERAGEQDLERDAMSHSAIPLLCAKHNSSGPIRARKEQAVNRLDGRWWSVQCGPTDGYPARDHDQYDCPEQGDYRDDPEHEGEWQRNEGATSANASAQSGTVAPNAMARLWLCQELRGKGPRSGWRKRVL